MTVLIAEVASEATPASGHVALYPKTDSKLYIKNDVGTEEQVGDMLLDTLQVLTKPKRGEVTVLTPVSGAVAVDFAVGYFFSLTPGADNITIGAPTNVPNGGQAGSIYFTQHASPAKTVAINAVWKPRAGGTPLVSVTLGAKNLIKYEVQDATTIWYEVITGGVA